MDEEKLKNLLNDLKEPVEEYNKLQANRQDTGFNIFYLISDYYYRETFHGDIIAALLSPEEKHNARNLYLNLFLEMVNHELNKTGKGLYVPFYENAIVKREMGTNDGELRGRIDIFIEGKDKQDKHCVVVENKLNNAPDTPQQLEKYYNDLKNKGYKVDAFVYMPLDPSKKPYDKDWEHEVKKYINEHLVIIPAYSKEGVNLINNWLEPAVEKSNSESLEEAKFVLKQYIKLLNNLTIDIMDNKKIISILKNNIDTAFGIFSVRDDFYNEIKNVFIGKIKEKLEELQYKVDIKGDNRIEIKKTDYPSWTFIIERLSINGTWYRGLEYTGKSKINTTKFCGWNKESENYPLGWEYYGEKKGEEYKGHWDNLETLRIMCRDDDDKSFANEIVKEVDDAFEKIKNLPK